MQTPNAISIDAYVDRVLPVMDTVVRRIKVVFRLYSFLIFLCVSRMHSTIRRRLSTSMLEWTMENTILFWYEQSIMSEILVIKAILDQIICIITGTTNVYSTIWIYSVMHKHVTLSVFITNKSIKMRTYSFVYDILFVLQIQTSNDEIRLNNGNDRNDGVIEALPG